MIHVECYSFAPFILNQRSVYLVYFKFKPKDLEVQRPYSAEPKIHVSRLRVPNLRIIYIYKKIIAFKLNFYVV